MERPADSADGKNFIFCADGWGGKGKHDVFICERTGDGWSNPQNIEIINSEEDDFDPVLLHDSKTIIFTKIINENEAYLFVSFLTEEGYSEPVKLNSNTNIKGTWNFGSSISPLYDSYLFYSTRIQENSKGRLDIYMVKYNLSDN